MNFTIDMNYSWTHLIGITYTNNEAIKKKE